MRGVAEGTVGVEPGIIWVLASIFSTAHISIRVHISCTVRFSITGAYIGASSWLRRSTAPTTTIMVAIG